MTKKRFLPLAFLTFALAACDELGPVATELKVAAPLSLKAESGRTLRLDEGDATDASFLWKNSTKKAYVDLLGERVIFKNAKLNSSKDTVTAHPADSEQNGLGIQGKRELVCNAGRCETVRRETRETACTYYERRPYTRCYYDSYGRRWCETVWEDVPMRGYQLVEYTHVTRSYRYGVKIFDANSAVLASGSSLRPETTTSERAVSPCR
jgi:hypothetical protein